MSRSYMKQPVWKDHNKGMKQTANRRVRRALKRDFNLHLPYRSYRKFCQTYDICDYCCLMPKSFEDYWQNEIRRYNRWNKRVNNVEPPEKSKILREWHKIRGK